ncbi:hypothetical protein BTZ20_0774 [Rhodococcus sp. MTM3W5.2]|nr:hypothetical protein BTZ20_0774 [Rhodococcus sp. MTM3W5.2]
MRQPVSRLTDPAANELRDGPRDPRTGSDHYPITMTLSFRQNPCVEATF